MRRVIRLRRRAGIRAHRPYCARHSSVSWNLMIGKNPLWVARQHGHSVRTMLEIYAAWAEGSVESDVAAIEQAMGLNREKGRRPDLIFSIRRLFGRATSLDVRVPKPTFSIWHWIWHQRSGLCS